MISYGRLTIAGAESLSNVDIGHTLQWMPAAGWHPPLYAMFLFF